MESASALLGALIAGIVIGIFHKLVIIFNIWNSKDVKDHQERSNCLGSSIAEKMREGDVTAGLHPRPMQMVAYPVNGGNDVKHSSKVVDYMQVATRRNDDASSNAVYGIGGNAKTKYKSSFRDICHLAVATGNPNPQIPTSAGRRLNIVYGIGGNGETNIEGCFEKIVSMDVAKAN